MQRRAYLKCLLGTAGVLAVGARSSAAEPNLQPGKAKGDLYDVRDFGARGDASGLDTEAIQKAIDLCSQQGGGTVYLPKGDYLCRTLILKSNVLIHLAAQARLLATGKVEDYAPHRCLLYAREARQIGLTGQGIIDGRGKGTGGQRYQIIRFEQCRDIRLSGIEMRDASAWCTHLFECRDIHIDGVTIDSAVNANNDGFDIDSSQNVFISNCSVRSGDDAIALKTNSTAPCANITVTNCVFASRWAAFRFGPEARGNFERITVSNCVIRDTFGCGIKLQMNEGARMKDIIFNGLVMDNVTGPISLRLANWVEGILARGGNEARPIGQFENVLFSNIRARVAAEAAPEMYDGGKPYPGEAKSCISITGVEGHPITGITLDNIHITFPGGGTASEAARRQVPDLRDTYPEYFMFGVLPAYGLYAHHAKGLTLQNVRFELAAPDLRPAIVCDDVDDLELSGFRAEGNTEAESLIRLQQTRRAFIHGSRPLNPIGTFLRVEGARSEEIILSGNQLRRAKQVGETAKEAPPTAIETSGRD